MLGENTLPYCFRALGVQCASRYGTKGGRGVLGGMKTAGGARGLLVHILLFQFPVMLVF